jgi:hypothetical protein
LKKNFKLIYYFKGNVVQADSTAGQIFYTKGGVLYGSPYHNLNETRFTAQIIASKTKIVRLTLDVELGWVYFTNYTNDKQYVAASRYNYLLHTTQGLLSYAGQSDPWTRPSFVLDQPDNLIFWTQSSAIMRAISNGAQITTISDPKLTVSSQTKPNLKLLIDPNYSGYCRYL